MNNEELLKIIEEQLQTVYDPEFPIVDIFTMGLIYDIKTSQEQHTIDIIMTFTSPSCPMWDMIVEMIKTAISNKLPDRIVNIEITFEPMRSPEKIKDEDLQRMFM